MFVKDQIRSIYFKTRRIIRKTKNLLRWLPIIWRDEQWDHYYIFEILKHKLIIMSNAIRENGNHTLAEYDADRMMLAVRLIEKVQNEDYLIEFIDDDNLTKEKIIAGERKHKKAKRILFKLLENYIERWWD
jgi:hypothetical protein